MEQELNKYNLNRVLWDITELCRTEILNKPRTQEKANNLILEWWNNKKDKPSISEFRLSYNCLYLLRKEYNKRKRGFKMLNFAIEMKGGLKE